MTTTHALEPIDSSEFWHQLVPSLIEKAKKKGATQSEVTTHSGSGFTLNVRQGEVDTVEYSRDRGVSITVYFGQRRGSATTSDVTPEALDKTIEAACHIAGATGEDACSGIPEKTFLAYDYPELSLCHPWSIDVEEGIVLARACEAHALSLDKRIRTSEGASVSTRRSLLVQGNSAGFLGSFESSSHSLSCQLLVGTESDMQRDYDFTVARDPADLQTLQQVASGAVERTLSRLDPRRLSTRQVPVLFDATIASGLIASFIGAISGGAQYKKASFLLGAIEQPVFPSFVQIYEKPHLLKGIGSAPFDAEGVKTFDRDFVVDGVLKNYVLSVYTARKLGLQPTGNAGGVHNLFIKPGPLDQKALLKQMHTGLWVTELIGHGTNMVTGDYSHGATGFWVENGEVQYPVHEITIAGNLKEMFRTMVAVGNDVDRRRNIQTGSILLERMTVAGE
jgi:PmbA protein